MKHKSFKIVSSSRQEEPDVHYLLNFYKIHYREIESSDRVIIKSFRNGICGGFIFVFVRLVPAD